jgi:hypothetical protein
VADYTDLFTRADNASLGSPWVETEAPNANAFQILTNALYQRTRAWRGFIYYNDVVGADQKSKLTFESIVGSPFGGPAVRIDPAGTAASFTGYVARYSGAVISLRKYNAETLDDTATGTEIGSYTVTLIAGDTVEIKAVGTTISVLVNDVVQISVTDTLIADGEMSVASIGAGAVGNDFTWSAWAGGDVSAPPPPPPAVPQGTRGVLFGDRALVFGTKACLA